MARGAGGTEGGVGAFFMGLLMMCTGGYMLLQAITVRSNFSMGMSFFRMPTYGVNYFNVTGGMIFIPFIFGVGLMFYNSKNILAWVLTFGSMAAMIFGVISNTQLILKTMSSFELITILVLLVGGIGIFLRSLKKYETQPNAVQDTSL